MKKLWILAALALLLAGCTPLSPGMSPEASVVSPSASPPSSTLTQPETPPEMTLPPLEVAVGGPFDPEFELYYVWEVHELTILISIVGEEKAYAFFNDVVEKNKFNENGEFDITRQSLWQGIQYFGITKDEFIAANEETKRINELYDGEQTTYPDYVIDALFLEDAEERTVALLNPNVLYRDGKFFNIYDLMNCSYNELLESGFSEDELSAYVLRIQGEMAKRENYWKGKSMLEWYMPYFEALSANISNMP